MSHAGRVGPDRSCRWEGATDVSIRFDHFKHVNSLHRRQILARSVRTAELVDLHCRHVVDYERGLHALRASRGEPLGKARRGPPPAATNPST
jgi:hypothetical protein